MPVQAQIFGRPSVAGTAAAAVDMQVEKTVYNANSPANPTDTVNGTVAYLTTTQQINQGGNAVELEGMIAIEVPQADLRRVAVFTLQGQSGSAVLDAATQNIVGLVVARAHNPDDGRSYGYACDITAALTALGATLVPPSTSLQPGQPVPQQSAPPPQPPPAQ